MILRLLVPLHMAAALAIIVLALAPGQALANHVQCGDVITQDTTLDGDVLCPGLNDVAISINAPFDNASVTLDLNRYSVTGWIKGGCRSCLFFDHLEVKNGTVNGPVALLSSRQVSIHDLVVREGSIEGGAASETSIVRNTVIGAPDPETGANSSGGIAFHRTTALVEDNSVSGPRGSGIRGDVIDGVIRGNVVVGGAADGLNLGTAVSDLLVRGNRTARNAGDGINAAGDDLVFDGNSADRNGGDGINLIYGSATVTRNHAWWNGNFGIEASNAIFNPQVTGGGNWAKHNGNPAQCVPAFLCSTKGKPRR